MRIVFLGTPEVAVPPLRTLVEAGHDVRLVVTRPDRPVGRSGKPKPPPVKREAEAREIEVEQPKRVRGTGFTDRLRAAEPEVLVVVAYGRILPRPVLDLAPHGAVNLHFSILPAYRGAAPVQWALAHGETVTGVTTMRLNERMDEGDILLQQELTIGPDEHAPALQARLAEAGCALLLSTLAGLDAGSLEPRPQDPSGASLAPILSASDGEIGFDLTAREIAGRVRGFDPWPGVWVRRGKKRLRIVDAADLPGTVQAEPGRVLEPTPEGLPVACGGGSLLALRRVQPEGRRVLEVRDAVNGRQIAPGDLLVSCRRGDAEGREGERGGARGDVSQTPDLGTGTPVPVPKSWVWETSPLAPPLSPPVSLVRVGVALYAVSTAFFEVPWRMTGRRRFRVIGLATALCGIGALGWAAQAWADLVRLESAVIDSCARVESASRIRLELVENLLLGAGPAIGAEPTARLGQATDRVREVHLSPENLDDSANYSAFRRAQSDLSEALAAVWDAAPDPPRARFAGDMVTDLRPEVERWSAALERSFVEMERHLSSYRASIEAFPGSLLAAAVRSEGSPAIATQALAGGDKTAVSAGGALR